MIKLKDLKKESKKLKDLKKESKKLTLTKKFVKKLIKRYGENYPVSSLSTSSLQALGVLAAIDSMKP